MADFGFEAFLEGFDEKKSAHELYDEISAVIKKYLVDNNFSALIITTTDFPFIIQKDSIHSAIPLTHALAINPELNPIGRPIIVVDSSTGIKQKNHAFLLDDVYYENHYRSIMLSFDITPLQKSSLNSGQHKSAYLHEVLYNLSLNGLNCIDQRCVRRGRDIKNMIKSPRIVYLLEKQNSNEDMDKKLKTFFWGNDDSHSFYAALKQIAEAFLDNNKTVDINFINILTDKNAPIRVLDQLNLALKNKNDSLLIFATEGTNSLFRYLPYLQLTPEQTNWYHKYKFGDKKPIDVPIFFITINTRKESRDLKNLNTIIIRSYDDCAYNDTSGVKGLSLKKALIDLMTYSKNEDNFSLETLFVKLRPNLLSHVNKQNDKLMGPLAEMFKRGAATKQKIRLQLRKPRK